MILIRERELGEENKKKTNENLNVNKNDTLIIIENIDTI